MDSSTHAAGFTGDELATGAAWSSFVGSNAAMLARGFRPAQVDATVKLTEELKIIDETLYISDDDANSRPTSIKTFAEGGRVGYSVAWVYDSDHDARGRVGHESGPDQSGAGRTARGLVAAITEVQAAVPALIDAGDIIPKVAVMVGLVLETELSISLELLTELGALRQYT